MTQILWTVQKVADYTGIAKSTWDNSRCTGKLMGLPAPAHIKLGYAVRYKKATIDAWLDALNEQITKGEVA